MKTLTTIVVTLIAMTALTASAFAFGPGWGGVMALGLTMGMIQQPFRN
jgi:hypothetical protein